MTGAIESIFFSFLNQVWLYVGITSLGFLGSYVDTTHNYFPTLSLDLPPRTFDQCGRFFIPKKNKSSNVPQVLHHHQQFFQRETNIRST
jgi:hypothetical protein